MGSNLLVEGDKGWAWHFVKTCCACEGSVHAVTQGCSPVYTPHLPRETRTTLSVVLHVPWCQHSGPEEALTVLVAPAYLVTSFGKLLCRAGHTAVVVVFGAVSTGLAREAEDMRTQQVTTVACTGACWLFPASAAHPPVITKS